MMKSAATLLFTSLIALFLGGCEHGADGTVGVLVPGASGRIVFAQVHAAGGHVFHDTLIVDSATARYEVVSCTGGVSGGCTEENRRGGDVPQATIDLLFETAQSRAFRMLKSEYRRAGDIMPPDGGSKTISVTVAEREQTIRWSDDATVPDVLVRMACWMNTVRGSLILCA